jgi:hypothetical protein
MVTDLKNFGTLGYVYSYMRNQLKNEEHVESSKVVNSSHAKREWEGGGENP